MPLSGISPLDAAARLAGKRGRVVMCAAPGDQARRWSFVAAEPSATLIARGRSLVVLDAAGRPARRFTGDPLDATEAFLAEHGCHLEPCSAAPAPRVFGYLGYDLARVVERLPGGAALGHGGPDLWLGAYGAVARWSAQGASISGADPDACAALTEALAHPARPSLPPSLGPLAAEDDDAHHTARIERARDYLAAGDVDQIHLARRLVARIAMPGDALAVHAALTDAAPAAYQALLETDGAALVLGSPTRFLASVDDHEPWNRPGTAAGTGYAVLLRAMFPADTITGAPRLRAMEVLDELEPVRRGAYGGALGYFGADGAFDLALAVRLGVIAQNELYVHAGAAIAAGSDAAAVLARTESDAAPWRAALHQLARQRATPPG